MPVNKFWKDLLFESGGYSQKRIIAFALGALTVLDAILLMLKSWIMHRELTNIDITFFIAISGVFGSIIGVSMINKMDLFRKSNNAPDTEESALKKLEDDEPV